MVAETGKRSAHVRLLVDAVSVAEGDIANTIPFMIGLNESFDVGRDGGSPVSDEYKAPFAFTGTLEQVVVDVAP